MAGGVSKIAQVAIGAVIGFAQGGPIGAAIGAGLAFYAAEQQEKLNTKSPLRDNEPSAQTVRSSKAPARFILGRVSTGGVLVWAQEQAGNQTDGEWLHLVYVLCEGAVDALEAIYLGEEPIATYGDHASYELVSNPTQVNAYLKQYCPDWKDEQIGRGLSFVRLSLKYSPERFPSGIPDARFIVRGRNDIFDPRTGMAGYTENTALHILWFLRNRCGVPDDEIVFETFASGANVCDESVGNPDGTTSPRYRSSCIIGADEQRTNVLQKLEAACGGKTIRVGGRWMFQAGAYYGPYDFEITEDMVIGTITGSTEPTNDAAINTVRGTFIDPSQSWTETDYPEVSVAQWIVEDGGESAETLSFSYVPYPYQAQRLASIELRRRRAGGTISVPMNFLGYNCRPGRAVRVNLPSLNILGEFIVTNWNMGASEGCTAQLQQYDAAQFDDAVGQPYNPIGFISLPAGGLGSPTNLVWSPDETAEVTQGVLSWIQPAGIVTAYAVTVRQGATAVQATQVPATTLQHPLSGLPSGNYTMSVAALGPLTRSGEASITVSIGGPPIPESCVVQATIDTITLIPGNALHGLNGGTYEYYFSTNPQATQGDYLGQGLTLTHTGLAFATNYAYFVRSKNAYGVSAFLKVVASTSTDVSNMLGALKDKIEAGNLVPVLRQDIALISGPPTMPGSVNNRLQAISDQLQEQIDSIADLADSMPYKPDQTYAIDQGVLGYDGKLYQAKKAVPVNNPPPNTTYWTDVGQAVRTADGVAARVSTVETKVTEQDGKITAQAQQIEGVKSSLAGKADASTVASLSNTVTQQGAAITAQGAAITSVQATVGQQLDNLLRRGSFEDGIADPWTGAVAVETVTVPGTSAGKAIAFVANSFCGVSNSVLTSAGQQFDLSADVCRQFMTAGQTANLQMQFYDKDNVNLGYFNAFIVAAGGSGFQNYSGRITAPAGAVAARFVTRIQPADGTGRALWCNMTATRVTLADIGNAIATSALDGRVTQTEAGLSVQGTAVTQLQSTISGIGGAGTNLLEDTYSWLTSTTLPAVSGNAVTREGVAVAAADSGFGYSLAFTTANASAYFVFSQTNTAAHWNVRIEPGVYLVSMYIQGSAAGLAMANLYNGPSRSSANIAYTTARTRVTFPITVTDSARVSLLLYPNRHSAASGSVVVDSVMIEKRIGEGNVPSPFVSGSSARAVGGQATAISQMATTVEQQGTAITAQANRLDGIYVQVNPEMEGDSSGMAGQQGSLVGVWTEQSARTDEFIATGKRVDTVQAQFGEVSASVQTISETVAGVDGKVSAISSWKTETNANGRRVATGIVQGSNGEEGEILLMAQRLAIVDGVSGDMVLPFVVQNGQVFINQAVINKAFIQEIVAGMTIRSAALNSQGLPLLEINFAAGTFVLRGQDANGSTLLTNSGLYVYDLNNIERAAIGRLT